MTDTFALILKKTPTISSKHWMYLKQVVAALDFDGDQFVVIPTCRK